MVTRKSSNCPRILFHRSRIHPRTIFTVQRGLLLRIEKFWKLTGRKPTQFAKAWRVSALLCWPQAHHMKLEPLQPLENWQHIFWRSSSFKWASSLCTECTSWNHFNGSYFLILWLALFVDNHGCFPNSQVLFRVVSSPMDWWLKGMLDTSFASHVGLRLGH